MGLEGADVAQLRTLAAQLTKGADRLDLTARSLHSLISNTNLWRGPDAHRFRIEWTGVCAQVLAGASAALREMEMVLRRNADEQDNASAGKSAGAEEMLGRVENDQRDDYGRQLDDADGVRIERVVGPDGETRLIVYLKGQDSVDSRSLGRSTALATGALGVDKRITRLIDDALSSLPDGKNTEIMLVGLSQGGMDAQNIAASGRFNVTNLVTYGSPIIRADNAGIATVHIRAEGDPVPIAGETAAALARTASNPLVKFGPKQLAPLLFAAELIAPRSDNVFTHDSPNDGVGFDVHSKGYPDAARAFDDSSDPRFAEVKTSMNKFEGTVTVVAE